MKVTREVFEQRFAKLSHMTREDLRDKGRMAVPCFCGESTCKGWRMISVVYMVDSEVDILPAPYNNEARRLKLQVLGREE